MTPPGKLTFTRRAHTYSVDGRRWSGASNWGKRIEDNTALSAWRAREAVRGVALDDRLRQAVLLADGRDELDDIVEQALQAAGANSNRDRGTEIHRITELADLGKLAGVTDDIAATAQRWRDTLNRAGIELLPGHVEQIVLIPEMQVCGTFDRLARWQGETVVLDLKTGTSGAKYAHSMAVQLALLAHADWITDGDGVRNDDRTTWTTFQAFRELGVSTDVGLIVAMPSDGSDISVHTLDLDAGWDAARLAHRAKQWTASTPAAVVVTIPATPPPSPIPIPDDPFDGLSGETLSTFLEPDAAPVSAPVVPVADDERLVDPADIDIIRQQLTDASSHPAVRRWYSEAAAAGTPIGIKAREWQTVRRFEIARLVITLTAIGDDGPDLDAITRTIIGTDTTTPVGAILATLTATQAAAATDLTARIVDGQIGIHPTLDGGWGLTHNTTTAGDPK
jgi:hypothetical protein